MKVKPVASAVAPMLDSGGLLRSRGSCLEWRAEVCDCMSALVVRESPGGYMPTLFGARVRAAEYFVD